MLMPGQNASYTMQNYQIKTSYVMIMLPTSQLCIKRTCNFLTRASACDHVALDRIVIFCFTENDIGHVFRHKVTKHWRY
jgi:hypothetical protein